MRKYSSTQIKELLKDLALDKETYDAIANAALAIREGQMGDDSKGEKPLAVMAGVDPTGISAAGAAYKKPLCLIE